MPPQVHIDRVYDRILYALRILNIKYILTPPHLVSDLYFCEIDSLVFFNFKIESIIYQIINLLTSNFQRLEIRFNEGTLNCCEVLASIDQRTRLLPSELGKLNSNFWIYSTSTYPVQVLHLNTPRQY